MQICLKVASFLPATATPEIDVATPATPAGLLAAAFTPGRLDGVPALPKAYVKREDLAWLKAALLEAILGRELASRVRQIR